MLTEQFPLILVVDDDPMQRLLVRAALEPCGCRCEEAEDGNVGIEKCMALLPDLIILDVMMPRLDGFSVCLKIRQNAKTAITPVLVMTALNDLTSIDRAYKCGATSFQTKPIDAQLLPYQVKYMLRASTFEKNTQEAQRLAVDACAAKSQFLANMSHELRTPLNAILGFSEVIYREFFGEVGIKKYLEYAHDIHDSAAHLLDIVNDILDISKIESGQFQLYKELCNLQEIVESVVQITRPLAKDAGVRFDVRMASALPLISTDEVRLKQVLINLLSNAIKFTPARGEIKLAVEETADHAIIMSVSDNGIGIHADQIERILSPFGQVDSDLNRKYEGTGLGLPLAKTLTERLGGTFLLDSQEGRGTRVTLTFSKAHLSEDTPLDPCKFAS